MSYQGRRRAPRKPLRDRIRDWWYGTEEEQDLTDDHGNPIGGDLPPVRNREMIIAGKCESCWAQNGGEGCDWASCGCSCHDDDIYEDWDEPNAEPQVIRTTEVGGVHLPNLGHDDPLPVNPRVNCAFAREVMPVGQSDYSSARMQMRGVPRGTLVNVPRRGHGAQGEPAATQALPSLPQFGPVAARPTGNHGETAAPGHLTMWDLIQVRSPWPPRTWPPIVSGPRIRPELRAALLAGTT